MTRRLKPIHYTPGFLLFWAAWPTGRKKSKQDAQRAWIDFCLEPLADEVVESVELHKKHDEQWRRDNGQFIPYPASFIRAGGWEDVLDTKPPMEARRAEMLDRQSVESLGQRNADIERLAAIAVTISGMTDSELERARASIVSRTPGMPAAGKTPVRDSAMWRTMIHDCMECKK